MSTGTRTRPNANPILARMRDDFGGADDPWGTAISWAFGVAEVLNAAGEDVPDEMGFRPGAYAATPDPAERPEEYPDEMVWEMVNVWAEATIEDLQFAGRCLARYLDWCKLAGLDY